MKSLLTALFTLYFCTLNAQVSLKDINLQPTLTLQLKLQSSSGANGSAVAWDPNKKRYHTAMAGNESFEIETFDRKGKFISRMPAKVDLRGLWFNLNKNRIEGNTYEYHDVISYTLDAKGLFSNNSPQDVISELPIYNPQAVLQHHETKDEYIWFDYETFEVIRISASTGEENGRVSIEMPNENGLNPHSIICTQIPGAEYGFLSFDEKKVYLFNADNGNLAATITLPSDAPTSNVFKFSFANNHIWLYDAESRTWMGYKL